MLRKTIDTTAMWQGSMFPFGQLGNETIQKPFENMKEMSNSRIWDYLFLK